MRSFSTHLRRGRWLAAGTLACLVSLTATAAAAAPPPSSSPSDPRADFFTGNAVSCAQIGFPDSTQLSAQGASGAEDDFVKGSVTGSKNLNVELKQAGVVVDAVVVKGGNAYNVYSDPAVLPPTLSPPQNYISPLNGGGDVPDISHWFVCYHDEEVPDGSLVVTKRVLLPNGPVAEPLPTEYKILVTCDNEGFDPVTLTFGAGGGQDVITGLPDGTHCTVVEQNTGTFPEGTVVTTDPAAAATPPGVEIDSETSVVVRVTNDFTRLPVKKGKLKIRKILIPPPHGLPTPDHYTVTVACDDGTMGAVILPGDGGIGAPVIKPTVGAQCSVEETAPGLPFGWKVSYSVDGGPFMTDPPLVTIPDGTTTVRVKNDARCIKPSKDKAVHPVCPPRDKPIALG